MGFKERKGLYKNVEQHRGRPLLTYITSGRKGGEARIAADAVREFTEQLHRLPADTKKLDLIVNSYGGDGLASWRLVSMIREFLGKDGQFTVLVPNYAFSAATLLAVGADEIYLHPTACLGPVDPQITVASKEGNVGFAYEDLVSYRNFIKEEGGISQEQHTTQLLDHLVKEIRPSVIGASKRSSHQSSIMASRLLKMYMPKEDAKKADEIAEKLNKSFFSHGHAVSRSEAIEIGLKISKQDTMLDKLLWDVFLDVEAEMKMREPFNPLGECLNAPANAFLLTAPPTVNVPVNTPPAFVQQYWQAYLSQNVATHQCQPIDYELIQAIIESSAFGSRFLTRGKLFAARKPDLDYMWSAPAMTSRWESQ